MQIKVQIGSDDPVVTDLDQFIRDNEHDDEVMECIFLVEDGHCVSFGGGAGPMVTISPVDALA